MFHLLGHEPVAHPVRMRVSRGPGLAHLSCRVQAAEALVDQKKSTRWWWTCQTCEQQLTGEMRYGLANAWWSQVCDRAEDDRERLTAAGNLAASLSGQGKYDEAVAMLRELLAVRKRVLGAEHPGTLSIAGNLASCLLQSMPHLLLSRRWAQMEAPQGRGNSDARLRFWHADYCRR